MCSIGRQRSKNAHHICFPDFILYANIVFVVGAQHVSTTIRLNSITRTITKILHTLAESGQRWTACTNILIGSTLLLEMGEHVPANIRTGSNYNKLCAWRHNMPRPSPPPVGAQAPRAPSNRCNVAVLSHAEYVPMLIAAAALHFKAAPSKAAWWPWPLTLKVVSESRVTWATSVPILVFLGLCSWLRPDVRNKQTDRRQTKASLNIPAY